MYLYMLDATTTDPLRRFVAVNSDDEAERQVLNMRDDALKIISFILCDADGIRCVWCRSEVDSRLKELPAVTRVTTRFQGKWEHQMTPTEQIEAIDDYERLVLRHHTL